MGVDSAACEAFASLSYKNCTPVDVKDLAGDEARHRGAKEKDRGRDLGGSADSAERYGAEHLLTGGGVFERGTRHVGRDPARSDAIHVNVAAGKLARQAFD